MDATKKPPYRAIADILRDKILSGAYAEGKLPSERALVRRYGISRATAGKVLASLEGDGLVVRRRGAGAFVRPGRATTASDDAPALVTTLVPNTHVREVFSAICCAIAERAGAYGLRFVWGEEAAFVRTGEASPVDFAKHCRQAGVRGVFFAPRDLDSDNADENIAIAEALRYAGIVVTLLDRDIASYPARSSFDLVGVDNVQAGLCQAKHLLECGCRRLAYVSHAKGAWTVDARYAGFRAALTGSGIAPVAPRDCGPFRGEPFDETFVRSVLHGRPDGIVFVNDTTAVAFCNAAAHVSRRRFRFIGMDDAEGSRECGLSTMRQPASFIGEEAVRLMALRLGHDALPARQILFPAELVARRSSLADPSVLD